MCCTCWIHTRVLVLRALYSDISQDQCDSRVRCVHHVPYIFIHVFLFQCLSQAWEISEHISYDQIREKWSEDEVRVVYIW